MSDDRLEKALQRIAALEAERSARPASAAPQGIDPAALIADPIGVMQRYKIPVDHVSRVLVANAMGDQASPELRQYAALGPTVATTHALSQDLQAMRQRLEQFDERDRQSSMRSSFTSTAVDKTKYPLLAAAYGKNPALFESDISSHRGDASALAATLESRLKATAEAVGYTPPVSSENTETAQGQSTQAKQAQQVGDSPPPITSKPVGVFTQETHEQLKDRILRKFS